MHSLACTRWRPDRCHTTAVPHAQVPTVFDFHISNVIIDGNGGKYGGIGADKSGGLVVQVRRIKSAAHLPGGAASASIPRGCARAW